MRLASIMLHDIKRRKKSQKRCVNDVILYLASDYLKMPSKKKLDAISEAAKLLR